MTQPNLQLSADLVAAKINSLPPLPAIVLELLSSIDDEDCNVDQITEKISHDQALVARLLRIANSPFYGLQSKVDSVQDAVVVLGLRQVRMLAIALSTASSLNLIKVPGFSFRAFWDHSLLAAIGARALAHQLKLPEENAFAAGLLHDVGRLALASCFPEHAAAVMRYLQQHDVDIPEAEFTILGTDHTQIGAMLAKRWGFPDTLCGAIADHHTPDHAERRSLTSLVHVADALSHALDLTDSSLERVPPMSETCWFGLGLNSEMLQETFKSIESRFQAIQSSLPH